MYVCVGLCNMHCHCIAVYFIIIYIYNSFGYIVAYAPIYSLEK